MSGPGDKPANCRDRVDLIISTLDETAMTLNKILGTGPSDSEKFEEPSATLDVLTVRLEQLQKLANQIAGQVERLYDRL